jgi:hypothetical protein
MGLCYRVSAAWLWSLGQENYSDLSVMQSSRVQLKTWLAGSCRAAAENLSEEFFRGVTHIEEKRPWVVPFEHIEAAFGIEEACQK